MTAAESAVPAFADVIIDLSLDRIDHPFTYRIPDPMRGSIRCGSMVYVPFGSGGKLRTGYVTGFRQDCALPPEKIKEIAQLSPRLGGTDQSRIELAAWMREQYGSTMAAALRTVLTTTRKGRPVVRREVVLTASAEAAAEHLALYEKKNQRARARLLAALIRVPCQPWNLITGKLHVTPQTIRALRDAGLVEVRESRHLRNPVRVQPAAKDRHELSAAQQEIVRAVTADHDGGRGGVSLIHGITGSGKTEVYIAIIEHIVERGEQAIVLIPEIALTYQTLLRFYAVFGDRVSVMNSSLTDAERADQSERARRGEIDVIIGPRSALFVPFPKLGVIVIDEEHEGSYKNESMPKYHAREVAVHIAEQAGACVVLGSATPSLDAYDRAVRGEYRLFSLTERLTGGTLPDVHIADMREEMRRGNRSILSAKLRDMLEDRMRRGEQAMLFLNRRGYAGHVACRACGEVIRCPHCDVSLSYHRGGRMMCHYCGYSEPAPKICPSCGSKYISGFRAGTEQVELAVRQMFPGAGILRMDADTTRKKDSYEQILSAFSAHEADILIGTQMIVKGHDFPDVTLVGVLLADLSLYAGDYRAAERTFQLLTQAAGRAGRGARPGEVVIQTYQPEHYAVRYAASQDYRGFYEEEIAYRRLLRYPPASHMLAVQLMSPSEDAALAEAGRLREVLEAAGKQDGREIIGPAAASLGRLRDQYRFVLYIKSEEYDTLVRDRRIIENARKDADERVLVQLDFDPVQGF